MCVEQAEEEEQMMIKIFSTKEVDSIVSRAQRLLLLFHGGCFIIIVIGKARQEVLERRLVGLAC